jgi:hypothetical protein
LAESPWWAGSSGRSSRSMTSFGSGLLADEALGGTSTSGVIGKEAGDGLALFFGTLGALGGWLPELQKKHKSKFERETRTWISEIGAYLEGLKKCWMAGCPLLLVLISERRFFSASAFRVAAVLSTSRGRFAWGLEGAGFFLLAGRGASGASASDATSGSVLPVEGTRRRIPSSLSSSASS